MSSKKYLAIVTMIIALLQMPILAQAETKYKLELGFSAYTCKEFANEIDKKSDNEIQKKNELFFPVLFYAIGLFTGLNIMNKELNNNFKDLSILENSPFEYLGRFGEKCKKNPDELIRHILLDMYHSLPAAHGAK